jgi:hypothetical protein
MVGAIVESYSFDVGLFHSLLSCRLSGAFHDAGPAGAAGRRRQRGGSLPGDDDLSPQRRARRPAVRSRQDRDRRRRLADRRVGQPQRALVLQRHRDERRDLRPPARARDPAAALGRASGALARGGLRRARPGRRRSVAERHAACATADQPERRHYPPVRHGWRRSGLANRARLVQDRFGRWQPNCAACSWAGSAALGAGALEPSTSQNANVL